MRVTFTFEDGRIHAYQIKQNTFIIGRSPKCHVCVKSTELSREHCRVEIVNHQIYLTDLESSNGVWVNNVILKPNVRTKYLQTTQLQMGDCYVVFDLSSAELTRSMVNLRPLLEDMEKIEAEAAKTSTKIISRPRQIPTQQQHRKEKLSSTILSLVAWALLLTGTTFYADFAFHFL